MASRDRVDLWLNGETCNIYADYDDGSYNNTDLSEVSTYRLRQLKLLASIAHQTILEELQKREKEDVD